MVRVSTNVQVCYLQLAERVGKGETIKKNERVLDALDDEKKIAGEERIRRPTPDKSESSKISDRSEST